MTRNTARIIGTSMLAMGVLLLCTLPLAAQDNPLKPTVTTAVASGIAPSLRELIKVPQPAQYGFRETPPLRLIPKGNHGVSVDPVEQRGDAPASNFTIGANNLGVGHGFQGYQVPDAPPDTNMAVGATQILQWVNVSYTICDKHLATCTAPILGNTLWAAGIPGTLCAQHNAGDILAQYDAQARGGTGAWFLSQNVFNSPYAVCIAISDTNNALTSTWHVWQFSVPGNGFPDYPKIGIWPTTGVNNGYYESWNNFGPGGSGFVGPKVCAYDRANMLLGAPTPTQICFQLSASEDSLLPGDLDSSLGPPTLAGASVPPCVFCGAGGAQQDEFYIGSVGDVNNSQLSLYQFHADFTTPANSMVLGSPNLIQQTVPTYTGSCSGSFGGDCVPQKGITDKADSLGDRLMYRFAYWNDGAIQHWYVNGDVEASGGQIGVRWYEFQSALLPPHFFGIRTLSSSGCVPPAQCLTTAQAGTYAPDGNWRWMGSLTQDKNGDILLGYSESCGTTCPGGTSGGVYPSVFVAGRVPSDANSTLEAELMTAAGAGSQPDTSNRWGDYSAMRIDPIDHCTFWYTQEYYLVTQSFDWSTQITSVTGPSGCTTQ
jgi:hypothetical protein